MGEKRLPEAAQRLIDLGFTVDEVEVLLDRLHAARMGLLTTGAEGIPIGDFSPEKQAAIRELLGRPGREG